MHPVCAQAARLIVRQLLDVLKVRHLMVYYYFYFDYVMFISTCINEEWFMVESAAPQFDWVNGLGQPAPGLRPSSFH